MKRTLLLAISWLFIAKAHALSPLPGVSEIYVFGNSLSDNGNVTDYCEKLKKNPYLPQCAPNIGVYTNGKNAVEYLADYYRVEMKPVTYPYYWQYQLSNTPKGTNYAVGGTVIPVSRQVEQYLHHMKPSYFGYPLFYAEPEVDEFALHVFFLGANYIGKAYEISLEEGCSGNNGGDEICYPNALAHLDTMSSEVRDAMASVLAAGGERFLVVNTDDLSSYPFYNKLNVLDKTRATYLSNAYNQMLKAKFDILKAQQGGYAMIWFDLDDFVNGPSGIKTNAPALGFSNIEDACTYGKDIYLPLTSEEYDARFGEPADPFQEDVKNYLTNAPACDAAAMESYYYFDMVHWSSAAHKLVAEGWINTLTDHLIFIKD